MEETFTCSNCGVVCPGSELTEFDGQELCEGCLDETTLLCEHCGERIWREENAGSEDCPLCQDCYDHHYDRCSDCGRLIRNTDAYYVNDDEDTPYYCRTSGGKVFVLDLSSDGNMGDIMILNPDNQFVYGVMIASGDSPNDRYEKLFKEYYEYCQSYYVDTAECSDPTAPSDPTGDSSGVSDDVLLNNAYQAIIDYCANYEGSLNPDCYPKNGKVNRTGSVAYVTVDQWDMQIWWQYYIPKNATVLLDEATGTVMQCTVNY